MSFNKDTEIEDNNALFMNRVILRSTYKPPFHETFP